MPCGDSARCRHRREPAALGEQQRERRTSRVEEAGRAAGGCRKSCLSAAWIDSTRSERSPAQRTDLAVHRTRHGRRRRPARPHTTRVTMTPISAALSALMPLMRSETQPPTTRTAEPVSVAIFMGRPAPTWVTLKWSWKQIGRTFAGPMKPPKGMIWTRLKGQPCLIARGGASRKARTVPELPPPAMRSRTPVASTPLYRSARRWRRWSRGRERRRRSSGVSGFGNGFERGPESEDRLRERAALWRRMPLCDQRNGKPVPDARRPPRRGALSASRADIIKLGDAAIQIGFSLANGGLRDQD
jgi:hypothetical protein